MRALLDVNVLLALQDDSHQFCGPARAWAASMNPSHGYATCALTQNGFLRISTQTSYTNRLDMRRAFEVLRITTQSPNHQFWPSDLSLLAPDVLKPGYLLGHRQLTDVYLLALAVKHGGCLLTFEDNIPIEAVLGAKPKHLVLL